MDSTNTETLILHTQSCRTKTVSKLTQH